MSNKKKVENATSTPQQSRTFTFELYPEWSYFNNIVSHIVKEKYALILHDKDVNEDGEVKKPHVHAVVKYGGKRTVSSVKNEFAKYGLEKRFVDTCNERAMLRYLIHQDNPEKYQYKKSEIDTNMKSECETAWADEVTSEEALALLIQYIEEKQGHISYTEMVKHSLKNNLVRGMKAYNVAINNMIKEHNDEYLKNNKIADVVDRETVREIVKEHSQLKQSEAMADMFGTTTIEENNGDKYVLYKKAEKQKPQEQEKNEVWQGLDEWRKENE